MSIRETSFTEEEWNKLGNSGITPDNIEKHGFAEIKHAISPSLIRGAQLLREFTSHSNVFTQQLSVVGSAYTGTIVSQHGFTAPENILHKGLPVSMPSNTQLYTNTISPFNTSAGLITNTINSVAALRATAYVQPISNIGEQLGVFGSVSNMNSYSSGSVMLVNRLDPMIGPTFTQSYQLASSYSGVANMALNTGDRLVNQGIATIPKSSTLVDNLFTQMQAPQFMTTAFDTKISAIPGFPLTLNSYQLMGVAPKAGQFRVNTFEQAFVPGITNTIKSAYALNAMGESALSKFEWSAVGVRFDIPKPIINTAQTNFLDFTKQYSNVLTSVNAKPNWIYEAPGIVKLPAEQYYSSSQILRLVTDKEVDVEELSVETITAVTKPTDYLLEYLPRLHPDLSRMWDGAVYALNSNNPDRIRHFIISLRELFTHVIHILAPDNEYEKWDSTKQYYYNDKPTRQGRLFFVCRNMAGSDKAFGKFMKNDVESAVSLINMFQGATHRIRSDYSPNELQLILLRAEQTLRTLLRVEFDINRQN